MTVTWLFPKRAVSVGNDSILTLLAFMRGWVNLLVVAVLAEGAVSVEIHSGEESFIRYIDWIADRDPIDDWIAIRDRAESINFLSDSETHGHSEWKCG